MTPRNENSWSHTIQRRIRQMILLLILLVVAGIGYDIWSHESIESTERRLSNYHLASQSHYLRAIEELRALQVHHVLKAIEMGNEFDMPVGKSLLLAHGEHVAMHNIIHQRVARGLALEHEYADRRFKALNTRLEQRLLLLKASLADYRKGKADDRKMVSDIKRLLMTLEQLVRLHTIVRSAGLEALHRKEHYQDLFFYALMASLAFFGALIARRSFLAIGRVIKMQVAAEEKITYQAHYDGLTDLPNRFLALDRLSQMIRVAKRSGEKVAVLFLDLDYFKKVNDMMGHAGGDNLLIQAAQRISGLVRAGDTVGRLGGDEFIVLIGGISSVDEINSIAENLIKQMTNPFQIDDKELVLTASVGISIYPDDGDDKLELIRKSDSAMYHSKAAGRNTYSYFTESINRSIARQLSVEGQINGALERGEFELVYQQKVDIKTDRIIGAEVLLRWTNPSLGVVSPDEFIPVAEKTGHILPIGEFVLTEALNVTRQWQTEFEPDFGIAVNLSPRQFRDPDLVNHIAKILHETGVPSKSLELEITEGVLIGEYVQIDQLLNELSRLGITIAMDDFGTGYSSLSYLRDYPFDVIKIDRSFVKNIDRDSTGLNLVIAAIAMAHALGIKVVAEGVETSDQLQVLKDLRCDIAQGYYLGKPVSAAEMTRLLESPANSSQSGSVVEISERPGYSPKTSKAQK